MEVINKKDNFLIGREEIVVKINQQTTPSFQEAKEKIASNLNVNKDLVVVKKIVPQFGTNEFNVEVFVYKDLETKNKFEEQEKEVKEKEEDKKEDVKEEEKDKGDEEKQ